MTKDEYREPDVTVFLPEIPGEEQNYQIVTINMISWKIMRGVNVQVPANVARVLEQAEAERRKGKSYIQKIENAAQKALRI